ncbi:hypothetical protein [Sphingomonas arenae]|uniref:hypothetical protein n=1 Tax=Sphingomonas arenae TaxID=2812555 RepID=UPI0019688F41|nr:hypothetical protein [Sphingomonas arenae]
MRLALLAPATLLIAACGQTTGESAQEDPAEALRNAANQSDPAAAQVLNDQANRMEASGSDNYAAAQQALQQGGVAQVANDQATGTRPPSGTVQARPNLPGSPNRKDGTQPPDKMISNGQQTGVAGSQNLPQDR